MKVSRLIKESFFGFGQNDDSKILKIEKKFNINLPESYCRFLKEYPDQISTSYARGYLDREIPMSFTLFNSQDLIKSQKVLSKYLQIGIIDEFTFYFKLSDLKTKKDDVPLYILGDKYSGVYGTFSSVFKEWKKYIDARDKPGLMKHIELLKRNKAKIKIKNTIEAKRDFELITKDAFWVD
jgi:hypothetical protein